jgi:integrase
LVKSLGVDAKVVQELLRHACFGTTMDGYTQALESDKRHAQAQLASLLMKPARVHHA